MNQLVWVLTGSFSAFYLLGMYRMYKFYSGSGRSLEIIHYFLVLFFPITLVLFYFLNKNDRG